MLTGKKEIADRERSLDSGADDYLTKHFSILRIRKITDTTESMRGVRYRLNGK